jgi:hypothetical protein
MFTPSKAAQSEAVQCAVLRTVRTGRFLNPRRSPTLALEKTLAANHYSTDLHRPFLHCVTSQRVLKRSCPGLFLLV